MKKKLLITLFLIIIIILFYFIYINILFKNTLNTTIEYENKINYSTIINLEMNNKYKKSKMIYDVKKSSNIKKININYYTDDKLINNIDEYIITNNNKQTTYINNKNKYEKQDNSNEFFVDYKLLKKSIVLNKNNKSYLLILKAYDAYNIIYNKKVIDKDKLNYYIMVNVKYNKDNFINKISYNIDNINKSDNKKESLKYKVVIDIKDINNHNKINLPFKINN